MPTPNEELAQSVEGALKAFNEYKGLVEDITKKQTAIEGKQTSLDSKLDALDKEKLAKLADDITKGAEAQVKARVEMETRLKTQIKAQEDEIKELKAAFARPGAAASADQKDALKEKQKKLFNDFCRTKESKHRYFDDYLNEKVTDEVERKALSVGSDPNGGYTVLPEMGGVIERFVFESSPIRQLASQMTIGTDSYEELPDNDEAGAGWVGELETRSETGTPVLGKTIITVNEMQASPKASQKILDDSVIDMETWISNKTSRKFARLEATGFVAGDGVNKPKGLLSYASGTNVNLGQIEQVNTGDAANYTYAGLVNLQASLKEEYQGNAIFLLKRFSFANIMQILDGQGRPIFNQMFDKNTGLETSVMGRPVRFANDMPAIGANALSLLYGDIRSAYLIVDRTGIRVLRDPFTSKPNIIFYTTRRVGGGVVNFEAVKLQKMA